MYSFLTTCVSVPNGDDINYMAEMADDIDPEDFLKLAEEYDFKEWILENLGYNDWSTKVEDSPEKLLLNDFGVSFSVSRFQGIPALYVRHSGIENIFIPNSSFNSYLPTCEESEERNDLMDDLSDKYEDLFHDGTSNVNYKKDMESFISDNLNVLEDNNLSLVTMHLMFNKRDENFISYLKEKENEFLEPIIQIDNNIENFLNEKNNQSNKKQSKNSFKNI